MKQLIITPEERAEIRRRFEILRRGHPITGSFSLGVHMDGYLRNYAHGFEVNFIGLLDAIEQAEAEVARLTKDRDWLAEKLADIADKMNGIDTPKSFCAACNICPAGDHEMEGETCLEQICEAARKAVAGEGKE